MPAMLAVRGAKCPGCGLPLARTPRRRMDGANEAAEQWKSAAAQPRRDAWKSAIAGKLMTADGRWQKINVALAAAPVVALLAIGAVWIASLFDSSPETMAARFTEACLAGDQGAGDSYLEEDAVQQVEFDRWRNRHFASIIERHRPVGDSVNVEVKPIETRSVFRILLVTMRSSHFGTRRHVQHWRDHGDRWLFDSRATMAEEDGVVDRSHRTPPAKQLGERGK
jgi:hypothetical protein